VCLISTPTFSAAGALPATPLTVRLLVTAAPASGIATSAAFSKYPPGGGVVGGVPVPVSSHRPNEIASLFRSSAVSLMFDVVSQRAW
jgi:hypothetical protein